MYVYTLKGNTDRIISRFSIESIYGSPATRRRDFLQTTMSIHRLLTPSTRSAPRFLAQTSSLLSRKAGRNLSQALRYSTTTSPSTLPPAQPTTEPVLPDVKGTDGTTDWSRSYSGLSTQPFSAEISEVLQAPIDEMDVEMKPGETKCFQCIGIKTNLHSYSK